RGAHPQPLDALHAEELVMDPEPRRGRKVVDPVHAGEEAILLARRVAEPAQHVDDRLAVDDEARLTVLVVGPEDGPGPDAVELLGDELEARSVRHSVITSDH